MGGGNRYLSKGLPTTTTATVASGVVTLSVVTTAGFPASGTLSADDGTNRSTITYTGKTGTTLTGVTGLPSGGLMSGAGVWLESIRFGADDFGGDSFEIHDYDNPTSFGVWHLRSTPNAASNHNSIMRVAGRVFADEGLLLADISGAATARVQGGSGAPTHSGTVGDFWFRTDTPTVPGRQLYTCTGGTNWQVVSPPDVLGWRSGMYYGAMGINIQSTQVNQRLNLSPIYVPTATTVVELVCEVTAASGTAGATAKMCVYADASSWPGALEYESTAVTIDSTGDKSVSGLSLALPAGWHWVGLYPIGSTLAATYRCISSSFIGGIATDTAATLFANLSGGASQSGVTAAPATFGGAVGAIAASATPRVLLKTA